MTVQRKTILTSFSDLTLPDGRRCVDLDRFELSRALVGLGVVGIDVSTGSENSMRLYAAHLEAKAAAVEYSAQGAANEFTRSIQATQEKPA